jgi:hypothetical protein
MKLLKLIAVLGSILVANAIYAADATVTGVGVGGAGGGYAVVVVTGSNNTAFVQTVSGTSGNVSSVAGITHATEVQLIAQTAAYSSFGVGCTIHVPAGVTATVGGTANTTNLSGGSASITIASTNYNATYTTTASTSVTLQPGDYYVGASASGSTYGGEYATVLVEFNY